LKKLGYKNSNKSVHWIYTLDVCSWEHIEGFFGQKLSLKLGRVELKE